MGQQQTTTGSDGAGSSDISSDNGGGGSGTSEIYLHQALLDQERRMAGILFELWQAQQRAAREERRARHVEADRLADQQRGAAEIQALQVACAQLKRERALEQVGGWVGQAGGCRVQSVECRVQSAVCCVLCVFFLQCCSVAGCRVQGAVLQCCSVAVLQC
jgi:hypothetical protein